MCCDYSLTLRTYQLFFNGLSINDKSAPWFTNNSSFGVSLTVVIYKLISIKTILCGKWFTLHDRSRHETMKDWKSERKSQRKRLQVSFSLSFRHQWKFERLERSRCSRLECCSMSSIENNVECFAILFYCWVSFINIELEKKLLLMMMVSGERMESSYFTDIKLRQLFHAFFHRSWIGLQSLACVT